MTVKGRILATAAITMAFAGMVGCGSHEYLVKDPTVLLTYQVSPTDENLENLSKALNTEINRNRKAGVQQPGLYCEYAVTLAKLGRMEEANQWFNNEVAAFPSATEYVKQVKSQLSNEYAAELASREEGNRWVENDIVVDNPDDIEQMRSNKPREASALPDEDGSSVKQTLDDDKDKAPAKKKKSSKKHSKKKSKKH